MKAYIEPLYSEDTDFEVYFRESAINSKKCINNIIDIECMFYEDGDENRENSGILSNVINAIKKFISNIKKRISNFLTVIKNSFGGKLTAEVYMSSNAANVRISEDVEKITKDIEDKILSERKGVQMISKAIKKLGSATNLPIDSIIDQRMIGKVIDDTNSFIAHNGGKVIAAAAAAAIGNRLEKSMADSKGLTEELENLTKEYENNRYRIHRDKLKSYDENGHKVLKLMEKLTYSVDTVSRRAEKYYIAIAKPLSKFKYNFNNIRTDK